jgi:hypothetical protein
MKCISESLLVFKRALMFVHASYDDSNDDKMIVEIEKLTPTVNPSAALFMFMLSSWAGRESTLQA